MWVIQTEDLLDHNHGRKFLPFGGMRQISLHFTLVALVSHRLRQHLADLFPLFGSRQLAILQKRQ
jgi:sigma54-dependent transcription regulator